MKKMWKRFVSLLLACTLLAGMLPLSASAAEKPGEGSEQYQYAQGILNQLNNELGDGDSKFQLSSAASLGGDSDLFTYVISRFYIDPETNKGTTDMRYVIVPGVGASDTTMPNYSSAKDGQPWAEAAVSTFYIAKGVTGIGSYAFASQPSLNNVVFQDASDLTYIGQRAFYDDDNAVFTDEGSEDENATLDLSGVTTMGEYAFYNCDKLTGVELGGSIMAVETVEGKVKETEHKIPNNAFNNSGLQTVTIPDGIQHIGDGAFGHTSLSKVEDLVLPDGLKTIGDNAFVVTMGSGETGIGITSLTIPSSVNSIGANAFSGRRNLAEVTVEDDNVPNTQLTLGNAAFGFNESSAFSEWGSITDDRTGQKYEGTMGTKFYLPADLTEKFINGTNCYTGDIEPMKWVKTQQPTCDTDGYHLYETTKKGAYDDEGKPLVLQYKYTIPMLGHDWDEGNLVTVAATCETPSYKYEPCTRGCGEINIIDDHVADALSHNYQVNENGGVMNPGIKKSNNTPTTVTYTCQNYKDGDGNLHDGDLDASYTWTIPATTLSATTSDTLADLQLPSVTGSTQASLAWADSVTTTEKLTEGTSNYQVKLVVSNDANFKPYTNADFTIEVKVEKTKLDFSEVYFENSTRWINGNTPAFSVEGMPEGTSEVKIEYKKKNEENAPWTTEKPKEEAVGDAGDYLVRYTFSYDPAIYDLVTNDPELSPPDDYTLEKAKDKDGEGTITGDYRVAQMTMESVKVSAINNLVFNGTHENIDGEAQPTVQLEGVLLDSKVTFTWTEDEKQVTETIDPTEAANFSGAKITNAGTYKVAVKIEKENYVTVDREVFVTIAKQPLTAPRAESNLRYDTTEKTGVPDSTDNRYTVSGNKQTNAGTYKAEAKVVNSKNYQWPEAADPDGDGTAEISWQILHRLTAKPTIPIGQYSYEEGIYRTPVTTTSNDIVFEYKDDKLVAKYKGETAYTATDAKETNAGSYKVTVHLENNNYKWAGDQSTTDLTLSWRITPLQIAAPTIAAADATYDGAAYAGKVSLTHSKAQGSNESSENIIDLEKTKISYYADKTGGEPMAPPVNVGTYYAGVEEWTFVKGELAQNYNVLGGQRGEFKITQKQATMEFTNKAVTATYTAEGTGLQQVTVDGLVDADKDNMATVLGDVKYTYKYSTDPNPNWESMEAQQITEPAGYTFTTVGYYQITAKWGAGTVSNNYTAKDAIYTLTIKKAEDQSITLTPDEQGTWTAAEGDTPANYTITYGEAATFAVIGTAALDTAHATISYKVKDGSEKGPDGQPADVLDVDSTGKVTIKQAGTATITVKAADTDNVTGTSVNYTVTVKKAEPTVNTGLEGNKLTVAYTGNPITDTEYNKATAAANVVEGAAKPTGDITYTFYTDSGCQDKVTTGGGTDKNVPIAVGTYYMKASYPGDTNYESAVSEPVTVTVTKAQLTVDAEGHTGTYNGETYPPITVKSVTGKDSDLSYEVYYMKGDGTDAPAAENEGWSKELKVKDVADSGKYWYKVVITGEHANDYAPYIASAQVTISAKELQLTGVLDAYTKTYDGKTNITEDLSITVTTGTSDAITVSNATGTYDNENAGEDKTVTLTLSLSGTEIKWDNYSYNGAAPTEGKITLTMTGAGTITPKAITVTGISAVNRVYDGTKVVQLTGEPKTEDTLFNEDETVFLALAEGAKGQLQDATAGNGKAVSVGNDAVEITGKGSDNYSVTVSLPNLTVDIEKATPTVTITGASENKLTVAYTGNPVNIAATVAGISDTDKPTGEVTFRSYKSVEAAQNDTTGTGGTELEEMPSNGGPYYLRAFIAEDTNYKAAVSDYVELVIDATALSVTTGEPAEKPYTGKEHNMAQWADMKVQFSGKDVQYDVVFLKKGEDETSAPDAEDEKWNSGVSAITNVAESGEYWYKVTAKEGEGNFEPHVSTSAITFTVTPATLTLSSSLTKEKEYDGTTAAVVTEQKVTGAQSGENITVSSVSAAYNDANEGTDKTITTTYKVTFDVGVTPGNYTIGNSGAQTTHNDDGTWTVTTKDTGSISAKSITVTIADKNKIYDGKTPSVTSDKGTDWTVDAGALCSQNGTVDELRVVLSVESDGNSAVVGTYAITGKAENKNYAVTFTGNWQGEEGDQNNNKAGTYTIDPRPINVQIGNAEGFYGDAPVLTGVTLTYESTVDNRGLAPDEENVPGIELGTGANKESPVAEYTIYAVNGDNRVELIKPVVIGNYNVTFTQNGTYTVKQRPITITIEDQESDYGCEIAKLAYSETLSNTYTGSNKNVVFVGDDEDELGITLSTTAKKGSDAGTYPISGEAKAESSVVSNYAITWKGETPFTGEGEPDSTKATYTVEKADLDVEFTNETVNISMGGQVENPLKYINASNENENLSEKPDGVTVTYSSSDPSVAEVNSSTGEVTLAGVGDATITANVTDGGKNFNSGASATYELHVAQDGGLRTTVTPVAGLTYTGKMQDLVTYTTSPEGATVTFTVTAQESGDQYKIGEDGIPQALDAGTYTVSWRTTLEGYREETGSITVTVAKADPSKGFTPDSVSVAYEENKIYDSTEDTILQVEVGYASEAGNSITYLSDDTQVARVEDNNLETILLNSMGTAHISARFAETENFQEQTVFFTLTVGQATTMINYTAEDYKVTYDGQAHGSRITVTSPSEYTIKYSDNQGASYDLDESPAITDAGSRTIYFQIQADGYQSAIGTQTVTVEPKPIKEEMIAGIAESYTYTGKGITFDDAISVHDEGVLLKQNTDYTVSYDQNTAVGTNTGSVTITGKGNYKESVTKNFTISPVDASDLTASLDRTFGYYGDSNTNNATVTVTHGGHTVTSDASNTVSVAVTQFNGAAANNEATVSGQTVTFNQVGTYTIEVTVTGNHATNAPIQLTYALLPVEEGELVLEADNETSIVATYGEPVNGDITVTDANGTSMTENIDYSLTYTYTPFEGTAQGSKPYDPSVMSGTPAAGMYVVTATGRGGYANSVGTFTFLILQRDLAEADLTVEDSGLVYNQNAQTPSFTVAVTGNPTADDYEVAYYNNVNASEEAKAVVTATGNNFTGSKTEDFTIAPKPIIDCVVENIPDQHYTGEPVTPPVTITDGNYTLILGYDYTTACDAIGPGTATVTIEGKGNYTETTTKDFVIKSEGAPEPSERFDLVVTPSQWIWKDDLTNLRLSVTFGTGNELTLGKEYTLEVNGQTFDGTTGKTKDDALTYIKGLKPGEYTITATGVDAYKDSEDTETVTVKKIQPELTVTAAPGTLSGGGKVTLTLKGENLPDFAEGQDLSNLLAATAKDAKNNPDLSELEWETDEQTGVMTAELTLPNTNETYTFTLTFIETATHAGATDSEQVVVAQQIISGGGGGGPVEDQPANPDDTGVSDWLNTKDHLAYLAGYPGGTFGPDQNMTRAEAAQMFYNLLLEKDVEITVEFEDVPADAWYAKPVNTLASLGILSGVGNGRFDPDRSITRAEFTVIAMKFANTSGGGVNIFSDVNEDDWFYSAVVDSTQYGWINGYPDGTFRPEATISRAEVTVIVNHMLGRAADRPYVIAHEKELNTFGDVNRGHWGYFHVAEATNAHEYHTEDGTESWTGLS